MSDVRIVTDSSALFTQPQMTRNHRVVIVPAYVHFGDEVYRLGEEIDVQEVMYRLQTTNQPFSLQPPTPEDFLDAYTQINFDSKHIISIHAAGTLNNAVRNAEAARQMILGRYEIAIIDSQTLSAGVGILVEKAIEMALIGMSFDEIVRDVRKAIGRLYTVFYVDSLETLCRNGFLPEPQAILGSMLGIKPFITLENGSLLLIEKAKTDAQAVDKLVEFASEFLEIEEMAILAYTNELIEPVRMLQDRLALELNRVELPTYQYGAMVAAAIGPDAIGLIILEAEEDEGSDEWGSISRL